MAMLNQSLDDMIKSTSAGGRGRGRGRGKGEGATKKGAKGAKGAKTPAFTGRQAGAGAAVAGIQRVTLAAGTQNRSNPYFQKPQQAAAFQPAFGLPQQQQPSGPRVYRYKAYIANVPTDWDEQDILRVMETAGAVEKLTVFTDAQGNPSGSGMVQYTNEHDMNTAVRELNGAKLGHNEIRVSVARSKQQGQVQGQAFGGKGGPNMNAAAQLLQQQAALIQQQQAALMQQQAALLKGAHIKGGKQFQRGGKGNKSGKAGKGQGKKTATAGASTGTATKIEYATS
eukprot:TRINITY_DN8704_c0_g1_i3.p2 TRINITY_DN8704_c0_g1~~TRINITY_DN8704_c0_g1_i3.p2  ORF type:complete len:297 (+),score=95.60 TRINITY_DN8704_c0_g1_i3:43-891(+)